MASHHRGHRLGMLVKILNIRRLLTEYPNVERIVTFNAAENDHMLAINVALGFRPAGTTANGRRSCEPGHTAVQRRARGTARRPKPAYAGGTKPSRQAGDFPWFNARS